MNIPTATRPMMARSFLAYVFLPWLAACVVIPLQNSAPRSAGPSLLAERIPPNATEHLRIRVAAPAEDAYAAAIAELRNAGYEIVCENERAREFETAWRNLRRPTMPACSGPNNGLAGFFNMLGAFSGAMDAIFGSGTPTRIAVSVQPESRNNSVMIARIQSRVWITDGMTTMRTDSETRTVPNRRQVEVFASEADWQGVFFARILENAASEAIYGLTRREAIASGELQQTPYGLAWREWKGDW